MSKVYTVTMLKWSVTGADHFCSSRKSVSGISGEVTKYHLASSICVDYIYSEVRAKHYEGAQPCPMHVHPRTYQDISRASSVMFVFNRDFRYVRICGRTSTSTRMPGYHC